MILAVTFLQTKDTSKRLSTILTFVQHVPYHVHIACLLTASTSGGEGDGVDVNMKQQYESVLQHL